MRNSTERGIAMITVLLVLMLMSALLVGFTTVVISDQRYRFIDRDRGQAFYAASGAIEKMTADLGNLFLSNVAPTAAQVTALTSTAMMPSIPGITYSSPNPPQALPASLVTQYFCQGGGALPAKTPTSVGTNGYAIRFCALNSNGSPTTSDVSLPIKTGPFAGLVALQTPYQLDVTARTATGGESHLSRTIEAVSIPVFQFGLFSDTDLSFFSGQNFNFGGRTHTNGNLWLAEGAGVTLTMTGKITAAKDVIRQYLSNGMSIDAQNWTGTVSLATASNAPVGNRNLLRTEGSVVGMPGSAVYANWQTLSLGATPANYAGYLKNGASGAKVLNLPLTTPGIGGTNADLVKRPVVGESTSSILFGERLMNRASLRILLSDTAADITNLPGVTATAPVQLDGDWKAVPPAGYAGFPVARSLGMTAPLTTTTAATVAGAVTIPVVAVPLAFQKPQLTVKNAAGTIVRGPFICTTWTDVQFQGCTVPVGGITSGWTIYVSNPAGTATAGAGNMPGDGGASTFIPSGTVNGAVVAGPGQTIFLNAGQTTWGFAANSFFINDTGAGGNGLSTPVTCSGATINSFTGCTGVPATRAGATLTTSYVTPQNTGTIGGFIKIEMANAAGVWTDVTTEILNYGIGGPPLVPAGNPGVPNCADPTPNAIVRLQRLRDNGNTATCPVADLTNSYEWWPNTLFDPREGLQRNADPGTLATGLPLGGVMHYVAIDARNLARWFRAANAPYNVLNTGLNARIDNTGYTLYFSDRRNNRNAASQETAEYGWEDFVNPGVAGGAPNNTCDLPGEDVNGNSTCETYGQFPSYNGVYNTVVNLSVLPLTAANARPWALVKRGVAQVNRPVLFRRALKLINGAQLGSDPVVAQRIGGLTVVSENPVYIQGDWNAAATFLVNDLHAATSVIADAVTLLSTNWNDVNSFTFPYDLNAGTGRTRAAQSYYRLAILAGKGPSFMKPADEAVMQDFGTDGGAHNFLRYLEGQGGTLNYRGAMATLFYSRQGVGTY